HCQGHHCQPERAANSEHPRSHRFVHFHNYRFSVDPRCCTRWWDYPQGPEAHGSLGNREARTFCCAPVSVCVTPACHSSKPLRPSVQRMNVATSHVKSASPRSSSMTSTDEGPIASAAACSPTRSRRVKVGDALSWA